MKRYLLTIPALILAAGCAKVTPEEAPETLKEIRAEVPSFGTKATLGISGGKMCWESGDEILVDNGIETAVFVYNTSRGVFVTRRDDFAKADSYKAIFPASLYSEDSPAGDPQLVIGPNQKLYPGYIRDIPMKAPAGSDALFKFAAVCAPVRIDFPSDRLADNNNGMIDKLVFKSADRSITYEAARNINSGNPLFIALPVQTYKGGIAVDITFENGTVVTLECSSDVSVSADEINLTKLLLPWEAFSGGDGSIDNPYLINSYGDFAEFIEKMETDPQMLGKAFLQTSDIDLSGNWDFRPIGSAEQPFTGIYDGGGHVLKGGRARTVTDGDATGLFRYTSGASIRNLVLEDWNMTSKVQNLGGFAGYAERTVFENCHWKGELHQSARFPMEGFESVTDNANMGICGGVAGFATDCSFTGCIFEGKLSSTGKNAGGIAGYAQNCEIIKCSSTPGSEIYTSYHCAGSMAGVLTQRADIQRVSLISECSAAGSVACFNHCGGIVGYMQHGKIEKCVVSAQASVSGRQFNIGGIAGCIMPKAGELCEIDRCTVYSDVKGQYCIGGIGGYIDCNDSDGKARITNCTCLSGKLEATGTNSSNYALIGGIAGWITKSKMVEIANCASSPKFIKTAVQNAPDDKITECRGGVGGVIGFCNNDNGETLLHNCWSGVSLSCFQHRYKAITAFPDFSIWGGVIGRCVKLSAPSQNYYCSDNGFRGIAEGQAGGECLTGIAMSGISDGTLLKNLNSAAASECTWVAGNGNVPQLECLIQDPCPKAEKPKRVSIIGDSISSFAGYTPAGYNYHYPCADGSVTRAEQTYWHQLIYRKLSNACLDVNMSYSGSAVANSDEAASGKRSDHWCNNSYVQRYIRLGGIGNPDIVVIHGGTNDWAHNDFCPLYPNADDCSKAAAPSPDALKSVFSLADAATGRAAIESLAHNDFCSAYVKLICLVKNQYPDARIVCVIGDYLSEGIEQSIIQIADHYGAKYVDLLAVNGFNDQIYMPKHDFNGTSGCHPDARAMTFIADKIYDELGTWLEE